jgi:transposase
LLCKDNKSNLIVQEEQFTTKTCGNCGCINENVGSNKIFKCDKCNLIADRDFHAARNILIKFLTLNQ